MTRQSLQQGYVSDPIHTRRGIAFKIRYRVRSVDGEWNQKSETLYGVSGKKAARAVLAQRLQLSFSDKPDAQTMTLKEFVEAYWKPYWERNALKPATRAFYQGNLNRHILPALGNLCLVGITPMHVEELSQRMTKASPRTIRNVLGVLQCIFSVAQDYDMINRSPVRNRHKPTVPRREKRVWSPEQVQLVLGGVPESHRATFMTIALTGARLGELLALQWKHIDLEARTIRIEQSLWHGQIVPPKTARSVRTLYVGEVLLASLTAHRNRSSRRGAEDFVFCSAEGKPWHQDVLRKDVLYPTLDRLGIPRALRDSGFHAFRHAAATFVNAQTGNIKLAQTLLGHSDFSTTADIYTHAMGGAEQEAAEALEKAIFGNLFPIVPKTGNRNSNSENSSPAGSQKVSWIQ